MGLDIILVTMLILLGVCKAAAINTRNDTLLGLCLQDDSHCTELGPNETCRSRGNEQAERYNTGICVSQCEWCSLWFGNVGVLRI